jgi:uridine phosphorylase
MAPKTKKQKKEEDEKKKIESTSSSESDSGSDSESDSESDTPVAPITTTAAADNKKLASVARKEKKQAEKKTKDSSSSSSSVHNISVHMNPHIKELSVDHYYHLGLDSGMPLKEMFGDVKFVILSGSPVRALETSIKLTAALGVHLPLGTSLSPIGKTERYSIYKVGPVLSVSHGMGKPSISIMLHEITKLLEKSGVVDPIYIRVGTCGGLGVKPGTVVISTGTLNGALQPWFPVIIFGKEVRRPCVVDQSLVEDIYKSRGNFETVKGLTVAVSN